MVELPELCPIPEVKPFEPKAINPTIEPEIETDKKVKDNLGNILLGIAKNKYCVGD